MKTLGTIFMVFLILIFSCYLCSQIKDVPIVSQPVATATPAGITFQTGTIEKATPEETRQFFLGFWVAMLFVAIVFLVWFLVNLLEPLASGLDSLVKVLDRLRKVIFDSRIDDIQVKKSDKMSDLDVEIAGARFEHDRQKALIALDRIQDVTDIEVIDKAHKLKMSQRYGRMMLHAQREAMKSEVSK